MNELDIMEFDIMDENDISETMNVEVAETNYVSTYFDAYPNVNQEPSIEPITSSTKFEVPCDICGNKFASNFSLFKHKRKKHGKTEDDAISFIQPEPDETKNQEKEIEVWKDNPWAVTNFKEFLMFNCPECDFKTKEEVKLMSHGLQTHTNAKEYFKTNPTIYTQHDHPLKIVVLPSNFSHLTPSEKPPEEQENQMKVCNEKLSVTNSATTVYKCDFCDKAFKSLSSLKFHTSCCVEKESERFRTCKRCSHVSPTYDEHRAHFRKCNHDFEHFCQECEYYSKEKSFMRKHYHLVHGKMKPGTIICDLCGHVSYSEREDKKHQLKVHSEKPVASEQKETSVICDECGRSLTSPYALNIHKDRIHQHISLRTCKVCEKVFPNISEVYKHHRDEHPSEPCSIIVDNVHVCECKICSKIVSSYNALYTHYKLSHKLKGKEFNQYYSGYNLESLK